MTPHAYLFVDGSSSKSEDIGGWAAVAITVKEHTTKILWGSAYPTTISRCELMPIIEGLRWIKSNWARATGYRVTVISDSEYTVRTLVGDYARRKNNELWAAVDSAASNMDVTYIWQGRNTTDGGTLCDAICGAVRRNLINFMGTLCVDPRKPEAELTATLRLPNISKNIKEDQE